MSSIFFKVSKYAAPINFTTIATIMAKIYFPGKCIRLVNWGDIVCKNNKIPTVAITFPMNIFIPVLTCTDPKKLDKLN